MTESPARFAQGTVQPRSRLLYGSLSGVIAAAVALGTGQLAAAFVRLAAAPVVAVGGAVIDAVPTPVAE